MALAVKQSDATSVANPRSAHARASKAVLDKVLTAWSVGALTS